jgi:mRNA capping enzyme, beta chain
MENAMYDEWSVPINLYKNREHVEIEWRLGRVGKSFDTNVGKETFEKLMRALRKYKGWEEVKEHNLTVYYGPKGSNKRITINEDTDEQVAEVKKRVVVADFPLENKPFDVRLGINTEEPCEWGDDTEASSSKSKKRWSFVRKNLSIDMTIMKGDPDDKDADEDTTYHVEFEIVDPTKVTTQDELYNILYKTWDVIKIIC